MRGTMKDDVDDPTQGDLELGYQHTLMYGRYSRSLGELARQEAKRLREMDKDRNMEDKIRAKELHNYQGRFATRFYRIVGFLWRHSFSKIGEDWVFLALLGIIVAVLSFLMDYGISMCNTARLWLYRDLTTHPALQYFAWISLPVSLVLFSAGFVHILAPQAIGSGIPEMKTILRGVVLKEYLTFRTLIAKAVGLTASLGSGMPLGKEGPLVHIASIVATLMSKLVTSFKGIYENESRNSEMLAAACAVGVSCCFAAPIGGVLFSIEVTSVYFAIRNYWRGFFSAVFGALMFRLLAYWFTKEETITAVFGTSYQVDFPYDPQELFIYALVGAFGGLNGAAFVWCHRKYVLFMRKNKRISTFLQKNRFIYPAFVSLLIASVQFPLGTGQFMASSLSTQQQIISLFSNFTWNQEDLTPEQAAIVSHWSNPYAGTLVNLGVFVLSTFLLTILASTVPVPSGMLIPVFKTGAAFGRLIGEAMHLWFPEGVRVGSAVLSPILPGGYAIVGAAAFSAGVTHSISICVVISEMTGQIRHIIPVMIAVLVSNAVSTLLQPSLYDSIIMIKKLPYLPDILPSSSAAYSMHVEDFMLRNIKYIWNGMSFKELKKILKESRKVRSFPLVETPESMILLGSIQRTELIKLIEDHVGRDRRLQVAAQWQLEARAKEMEKMNQLLLSTNDSPSELPQRRPSRFEVLPAPDLTITNATSRQENQPQTNSDDTQEKGGAPIKSILKRTNSFTSSGNGMMVSPLATPYSTFTGADHNTTRIRQAIGAILRKSTSLTRGNDLKSDVNLTPGGHLPSSKKVQLPRERVIDMSPEEQKRWEEMEMSQPVSFQFCRVDPAPFQLVERTTLLKVHSMFSLLGVNHAYVTAIGKLVGVVSLRELRKAIDDVNAGYSHASLNYNSTNSDSTTVLQYSREHSPGAPEDIELGNDSNDPYCGESSSSDEDDDQELLDVAPCTEELQQNKVMVEDDHVHKLVIGSDVDASSESSSDDQSTPTKL